MFDINARTLETLYSQDLLEHEGELLNGCSGLAPAVADQLQDDLSAVADMEDEYQTETLKAFRDRLGISSNQFTTLKRRAAKKYPDLSFEPITVDRVKYVQNPAFIEAEHVLRAPETEVIEPEIVQQTELSNGSALVVTRKHYELTLPELEVTPIEYNQDLADFSKVTSLIDQMNADMEAEREAARIARLYTYANEAVKAKNDEALIQTLIAKGYTPEMAVKIATDLA